MWVHELIGRRDAVISDHIETVSVVAGQLLDQAEFPIQVGLHGFLGVVGAFVWAAGTLAGASVNCARRTHQAPGIWRLT